MKKSLLLLLAAFAAHNLWAQRQVSGVLRDSIGNGVIAASVKLTSPKDTLLARTDIDGNFRFSNVKSSQFLLSISSLGFQNFNQRFLYKDDTTPLKLNPITLRAQSNLLKEVVVSGSKGVVIKQDTVEYRASDYPVRENSVAEDIIKKLPGVEVDKDGNVTTQGKSVTRVRVNGRDYFEGDLKTATQNLPAEIIEKIQIVDDYGDQARVTGIREGEADKIINIQIRPDKNKGMILNANAGVGNKDRYQFLGNGQFLNNTRQISTIFNFNNTNANVFQFLGGGSRGFGGGGRRGGNSGGGGGFGGFNQNGITATSGGGLNYRDEWSKKVSVYGSYRFTHRNNNLFSLNNIENNFGFDTVSKANRVLNTNRNSFSDTKTTFHNFNFNFEYKIDSLNYLLLSPSFSLSKNEVSSNYLENQSGNTFEAITRDNNSTTDASSPFFGGNVIYNHRFLKPGRNISIAGSVGKSENDSYQEARDTFDYVNRNDSLSNRLVDVNNQSINTNINVTYSEPIGKYSRIDFGYNFSRASYDNSRNTDTLNVLTSNFDYSQRLSNDFEYSFTTQRYSLNYRFDKQKLYNINIGLTAQPTLLEGHSQTAGVSADPHRRGFNFFPTARFAYFFARSKSLNINYSGRSTEPSFSQIQPVIDVTDIQRPIIGNPDLKSAFTQSLSINYNSNDAATGMFLNLGLDGNIINNRITRNLVRKPGNVQETYYLNTDGYFSTNANYNIGKQFFERKLRISLFGNVNFSNDVTFQNGQKNMGRNWGISQGGRLQINPNQNIEIYPALRYSTNWINYSLTPDQKSKAESWNIDFNGKVYLFKTFIVGFDLTKVINSGYGNIATNPLIINTYLEKQFFNRRGTFRVQGFDVMKEATNVSRSQSENLISNSLNNRLTRYVMATFSYRLSKFPGGMQPQNNFQRREGGYPGPGAGVPSGLGGN